MEAQLSRDLIVLPSVCDAQLKLSVPDLFAQFMDVATLHAEELGVGANALVSKGISWITVKTKVHILRRPRLMEIVTLSTRPLVPEKVRAIREYRLEKDGELLAEGKTEWAVIDLSTGRPRQMEGVFDPNLELGTEPAYPEPFARIQPDFTEAETLGTWRVRSTDVDFLGHMNNIAYLRAVFGILPSKELKTMPQGGVEIIFRAPCFEGEELTVRRRGTDAGWELAVLKENGTPAAFLKLDR
jgi:acyl-ACP thioesterase